jgi:hypothetical protein
LASLSGAKRSFGEPTKACLKSLSCRKARELGYPHELWTMRLLARHARERSFAINELGSELINFFALTIRS